MKSQRLSLISILALVFFLPIFFLPATVLPLGLSKVALLALGVTIAFIATLVGILREGEFRIPSIYLMWAVLVMPLVYFLSAFFGTDRSHSLFGYGFEVGTFGSVALAFLLFGLVSYTIRSTITALRALEMFLISAGLIIIFAIVKILSGGAFPVWGTFFGNMGNPIGLWTDYGIFFSIVGLLAIMALSFLKHSPIRKGFLYTAFFLSLILMAVINFSTAWILSLVFSVVFLVYLLTVERKLDETSEINQEVSHESKRGKKILLWPTVLFMAVSLLFVINPVISSRGGLGATISGSFGVSNLDVKPTLATTLEISEKVLKESPILGSGPNTFDRSWLLHKPSEVNSSVFWNTSFPFGFGFLPTQIASVGILGLLAWILFFALLIITGAKGLVRISEDRTNRFVVISSLSVSFLIWIASFFYVPSQVMLALALIFTGLFVSGLRAGGAVRDKEIVFSGRIISNFAMSLAVVVLGIGVITLGLFASQRILSAFHFQRALALSQTEEPPLDEIERKLLDAVSVSPLDSYYRTLAQLNVLRARDVLNSTVGSREENTLIFQTAVSESIAASQLATQAGPLNYENWIGLGSIFSSLVPEPFSVEGAYEAALNAYSEAQKLNPVSPEITLLMARLELDNNNPNKAREYLNEAISLKPDYADAYFLLTQLEIGENNVREATRSAETTALLSPNNAGVFFQLGLLKYSSSDWEGARIALERAIVILPDYANAKYYLGLTLEKLGDRERAVSLFQELQRTNPDNQEVSIILENLINERDPLLNLPRESADIRAREDLPVR